MARLWRLGAATALSVVAVAVPAQAKQFHVTGQQSTVTPSGQATQFLSAHGITVSALGPATISGGSWTLPIVGGRVAVPSMRGVLIHKGGIAFTNGTRTVRLRHFVVSRFGKRAVVTATANGRLIRLARVTGAHVSISANTGTLTGELRLTRGAARRINHLFGTHVVSPGADLGSATSTVTVG